MLSFQVSLQTRSFDDLLLSINTIKCFYGKMGEKSSFKKKTNNLHESLESPEATVNDIMESITMKENYPTSQEPKSDSTVEDKLISV